MSAVIPSGFSVGAPLPVAPRAAAPVAACGPGRRFEARLHRSLDTAAPAWQSMQTGGLCTVYQRLDWVQCMMETLLPQPDTQPLIVEIRDPETRKALMLLPFALMRRGVYSELSWLNLDVCDYAAPVLARDFAPGPEECRVIWKAALGVLPSADLLHIRQIPLRLQGMANPLAQVPGLRQTEVQCFGMALEGDPETLLKRVCSPGTVKTIGRRTRKLEAEGAVRLTVASDAAEVDELFKAMVALRRDRFGEIGRFDLLDRPEIEAFYLAAARRGLQGGPARLFGLSVGGVWIAVQLAFVHDHAIHCVIIGISNEWRNHSPGIKLMSEIMIWARRQGLTFFDLSVGDLAYKVTLGAQAEQLHEIAEALTLRGELVVKLRRLSAASKARLQRHPKLFTALQRARRALRRAKAP